MGLNADAGNCRFKPPFRQPATTTASAVRHIADDPARYAIKFDPSQPASLRIGSCFNRVMEQEGLLLQQCVEQSLLRQPGNGTVLELSLMRCFDFGPTSENPIHPESFTSIVN